MRNLLILFFLSASVSFAGKVLLLPFHIVNSIEDKESIRYLLQSEAEGHYGSELRSVLDTTVCNKMECAIKIGDQESADKVLYGNIHKLGTKHIVNMTIVTLKDRSVENRRESFEAIEDLEQAIPRLFQAAEKKISYEQTATTENVLDRDGPNQERRTATNYWGVGVGMLWPMFGTYDAWVFDDSDALDDANNIYLKDETKLAPFTLNLTNWWGFHNNYNVILDVGAAIHTDYIAPEIDLSLARVFGNSDFSPFVGGGLGVHFGRRDEKNYTEYNDKRYIAPNLNAQVGLFLFRTYNVSLFMRGKYNYAFNSDRDQAIAGELGIAFQNSKNKTKKKKTNILISFLKYYLLAAAVAGVVGVYLEE